MNRSTYQSLSLAALAVPTPAFWHGNLHLWFCGVASQDVQAVLHIPGPVCLVGAIVLGAGKMRS